MLRAAAFTGSVLLTIGLVAACDDATDTTSPGSFDAGSFDASTADVTQPSTCAPRTGTGTTHTAITADETWTAANSPHVIASPVSIPAGVTITIEPCATVQLGELAGILVEGSLVASGADGQPVSFGRLETDKAWGSIEVRATGKLDLTSANLAGGGNTNNGRVDGYATIDVRGDQDKATQSLFHASKVSVSGSSSVGVILREGGGFTADSTTLSVTGSASYPVSSWGRAAGSIPGGGALTGNAVDKVRLTGIGGRDDVQEDTTFKNLGVPYYVEGPQLTVRGTSTVPLLTIATGTTVQFAKLSRFLVYGTDAATQGAFVADGVTFTSGAATPAAGDWVGILTQGQTDARTRLTNSTVAYAGAPSQTSGYGCPSSADLITVDSSNNGAIVIASVVAPTSAWVTSTKIENSAKDGIVRGWTGTAVDFEATNTFTAVPTCAQTLPKPAIGQCGLPTDCRQ